METRHRVPSPREVRRTLNNYLASCTDLLEAAPQIEAIRRACERNVHAPQAELDQMKVSAKADDQALGVLLEIWSRPERQALQSTKGTLTTVEHALIRVGQARHKQ